jgi:hypothetical protein
MDELMARFVTNMVRTECEGRFKEDKQPLIQDNLAKTQSEDI